jgi:hypothetical protein
MEVLGFKPPSNLKGSKRATFVGEENGHSNGTYS